MKTSNQLFQAFVVVTSSRISTAHATRSHFVILHVKTDEINSRNILDVCYFTSESPGACEMHSEGNIEEFNLSVNAGDTIIWRGQSSSDPEKDVVNVRSINYHGGDNVFGQNIIKGNGQTSETVVGVVQPRTNGQEEKYTIKFTVLKDGRRRGGVFPIDPKITVKP